MQTTTLPWLGLRFLVATMLLWPLGRIAGASEDGWPPLAAADNFGAWHQPTGEWYSAGDAMLDPSDPKRLVGKPGTGVMINCETGKTRSLVTKQAFTADAQDWSAQQ